MWQSRWAFSLFQSGNSKIKFLGVALRLHIACLPCSCWPWLLSIQISVIPNKNIIVVALPYFKLLYMNCQLNMSRNNKSLATTLILSLITPAACWLENVRDYNTKLWPWINSKLTYLFKMAQNIVHPSNVFTAKVAWIFVFFNPLGHCLEHTKLLGFYSLLIIYTISQYVFTV